MMTSQTSRVAFGYPWTPYRIEHRPTYGPHTKEELQRLLDLLAEAGVRAWWYSVATKGSYPMFPSNYLPYRDDAVDYLPWLVKEAHARGIALFSWEYLTTAPLLAEAKPEWRWKFFDWDGPQIPRDKHYVCWNSPYGELLKKYCVEVVDELGFDGIWFDGAFMHGHGATGTFACCCDFCAAKYRKQTGRELPRTIDLREESVREYLEWRYSDHTEYWRDLSAYVRARDPQALIVFNYFNRFGSGIKAGSPLRRMAGDAPQWPDSHAHGPMEGMISTEVGHSPQQTMLLGKILRAVNDNYPVELWAYGRDTVAVGTPDPHPGPMLLHAYQCAAIGGFPSFGMGPLQGCRHLFPVLTAKLEPLAPYIPGIPEKTVGLVVSGCTKDYGYIDETHPDGQEGTAWNATLGMHNLLNALRLPSEVLLDNMLSDEFLTAFQAVVLPDVRCMSDDSGAALRRYVEHGGTLLAIGDTATHDELGRPRDQGLLDDLFGIVWRDQTSIAASLALESPLTSTVDPATGLAADGLPPTYQLPGALHLVRSESAEVLAAAKYNTQRERVFSTRGIKRPDGDIVEGAAILRRCVGSGQAIWVAPNIAEAYGRVGPNHYSRVLVDRLLTH
ncbi:MAG: hypothetical protein K9N51_04605, partial [Candidatus Pacebacteria bacterium]|nr:hypothetical protein [Candidatus Paceibacterota bacterium]